MARARHEQLVDAPAHKVWSVVGDFGALHTWHPMVPGCVLQDDGVTRIIDAGGMRVVEVLDPDGSGPWHHEYTVTHNPLPVTDYRGRIEVIDEGDQCRLVYSGEFTPVGVSDEDAAAMLTGFFGAGFAAVAQEFGG